MRTRGWAVLDGLRSKELNCQPRTHSPWFFSLSNDRAAGMNISIKSGTLRMMRTAQSAACNSNNNVLCVRWGGAKHYTTNTSTLAETCCRQTQMLSSNDRRWAMYTCERLQQSWPSAWDTCHHITDSQSPVTHSCSCHTYSRKLSSSLQGPFKNYIIRNKLHTLKTLILAEQK